MKKLCTHFGTCGGCSFQNLPHDVYLQMKREQVVRALARHSLENIRVDMPVAVAPHTRRRATVTFALRGGVAEIGFRAARSHTIVDQRDCIVLTPALASLIQSFRDLIPRLVRNGQQGALGMTDCDNGIDLSLNLQRNPELAFLPKLADWTRRNNVARLVINDDVAVQYAEPAIRLGGVEVIVPPSSFLQPTREGEGVLQTTVSTALERARKIVDLFAGCGTFTFAVAPRASVHAVDSDKPALSAVQDAARQAQKLRPITTEVRNLFIRPLQPAELGQFDAAILDPPRSGAGAQAAMLANSSVRTLAYVSCNPETFGRDARLLADTGFHIAWVKPVDQFLWSSHIELVALLERH
jgi:23S rRNA (uracil1939-C5)-methyltransferase